MAKRKITNLIDLCQITCVVQKGAADTINDALLEVGVQGATVHSGIGTGIREKMGFLGVAVDVEREIIENTGTLFTAAIVQSPRVRRGGVFRSGFKSYISLFRGRSYGRLIAMARKDK